MKSTILENLDSVTPGDWNRLIRNNNPFLRHEFLAALERNHCVGEDLGWIPRHIALYDAKELVGAVPLYIKYNSYGEFVFDWSWADACERAGMQYYPKLVASIPYTPVTGPRLLSVSGERLTDVRRALVKAAVQQAEEIGASSLHWLFTDQDDTDTLVQHGMMQRTHYQFHWHNHQYKDFDDFLSTFSAGKRKKVRRERRQVSDAGISIRMVTGADITDEIWSIFHRFYCLTFHNRYGYPTLTLDFFREIGDAMGENVLLILAYNNDECIAGAISFVGGDTLYGRHWGATRNYHSLHFEVCYYSAIDYCIRQGLQRYEAGAQGEHKLYRGFIPVSTASCHWISNAALGNAIGDFLSWERHQIDSQIQALVEHSPYKKQQTSG
jgi:predicted N-acyltransferase